MSSLNYACRTFVPVTKLFQRHYSIIVSCSRLSNDTIWRTSSCYYLIHRNNCKTSRRTIYTNSIRSIDQTVETGSGSSDAIEGLDSREEAENPALTEIITIYERMTKGRAQDAALFRVSKQGLSSKPSTLELMAEELIALIPTFEQDLHNNNKEKITTESIGVDKRDLSSTHPTSQNHQSILLDFNKYQGLQPHKYTYFSSSTDLITSRNLSGLTQNYIELLKYKHYWLNITNPNETDLTMLSSSFNIHDLTISDIREKNTEEKIEIFKHYTFISLKLMSENVANSEPSKITIDDGDNDFNILLFKDFVITLHNNEWSSLKDILGFLNLLCTHTQSLLKPNWVLFSAFIELKQDAQYLFDKMEPEINQIRIASKTMNEDEMSDVMKHVFDMEFQIYTVSRFIKPKMNILRILESKYDKRLSKVVGKLIYEIQDDFKNMSHEMESFSHILERSQDTILGLVNVEKIKEANETSKIMNRISQIALVFLPIQAVTGLFGMNVHVPFQHETSTMYFWSIALGSTALAFTAFALRKILLTRNFWRRTKKINDGVGNKITVSNYQKKGK